MSDRTDADHEFRFKATIVHWRGPSPYFFVPVPGEQADAIREIAKFVSYGWGMIPVAVSLGEHAFTTALFAKDDTYYLPLKDKVRRQANVMVGDAVDIVMAVRPPKN